MPTKHFDVENKLVLVAGGCKGLGKELSLQLVSRGMWIPADHPRPVVFPFCPDVYLCSGIAGAHVTIIARSQKELRETELAMEAKKVSNFINSFETPIFAVFCVAGGTAEDIGTLADIPSHSIRSCMEKNYFTSAYLASAVMKLWTAKPAASSTASISAPEEHHIIFTASTAALISIPGYAAYAPTKAALRSLADTLRQESLMHLPRVCMKIHCSFPGNIYTESFYQEQKAKPDLLKQIEGTVDDGGGLSAVEVAKRTLAGLNAGKYFITTDTQTRWLLNNMRGCSPKDSPIVDWLMGFAISLAWPIVRLYLDRKIARWNQ